jgi:hypothetical protein
VHLPAVLEGLTQAKRREFATDAEVEAAFRRFSGVRGLLCGSVIIPPEIDLTAPITEEPFAPEADELRR